jgi:hypothetical protein
MDEEGGAHRTVHEYGASSGSVFSAVFGKPFSENWRPCLNRLPTTEADRSSTRQHKILLFSVQPGTFCRVFPY